MVFGSVRPPLLLSFRFVSARADVWKRSGTAKQARARRLIGKRTTGRRTAAWAIGYCDRESLDLTPAVDDERWLQCGVPKCRRFSNVDTRAFVCVCARVGNGGVKTLLWSPRSPHSPTSNEW